MRRILLLESGGRPGSGVFRLKGWDIVRAESLKAAENILLHEPVRVGLVALAAGNPPPWMQTVLANHRSTRWIALVARDALQSEANRRWIAQQCHDFHTEPIQLEALQWTIGHAHGIGDLADPEPAPVAPGEPEDVFGVSPAMVQLRRTAERYAYTDAPILITGESGVGKERLARYLCAHSRRGKQPFAAINCAAIPSELMQTELFGYERGAFTGANERKIGRIESASGGTVFFDEVAELQPSQQASLLRFLEEGIFVRIGGRTAIKPNVRIIAATNRDLEQGISAGWFRRDLYHRLCVLHLHVPSLRERPEDIPVLAQKFLDECADPDNGARKRLAPRALEVLLAHPWPGNIRELRNRIRRAVLLSDDDVLRVADLGFEPERGGQTTNIVSLDAARAQAERSAVAAALQRSNGNLSSAAQALGISRMTLYRLLRRLGFPNRG